MKKGVVPSILLGVVVLAVAVIAEAQQPKKIAKVGALFPGNPTATAHLQEGFRQGLREVAYVDEKTVALEFRYGEAESKDFRSSRENW